MLPNGRLAMQDPLTATPINDDLFDLYNQLSLFTRGDRGYFAAAGIGDLHRYFLKARRESRAGAAALFNLLEEVVIRRTRPFIRRAYPDATIRGKRIRFPERQLRTGRYDLEATYGGIYGRIVCAIENLRLAPYNLETFKKQDLPRDEFEAGRQEAPVGIFKSRYLNRFESSVDAFRISVRRALEFLKTFDSYMLGGKLVRSTDFHRLARHVAREDEEDDTTPRSLADDMDASEEARALLDTLDPIDHSQFDLRRLHEAVQHDIDALTEVWHRVRDIRPERDAKLHFWRYYDLADKRIIDNRYVIANLIACERDTPRVVGDYDVFTAQEEVIDDILRSYQERQALEEAPKTVDPLQQTIATTIQGIMNQPEVVRQEALAAIRFLSRPAPSVVVKELRAVYRRFQRDGEAAGLVGSVVALARGYGASDQPAARDSRTLRREDLRLICFDYLCP